MEQNNYNNYNYFLLLGWRKLLVEELIIPTKVQSGFTSRYNSPLKICHLPIVLYEEDGEYIAECPLFHVSSHGHTTHEALDRVKEALTLYLEDSEVQKALPSEVKYTKEEMLQKAEQLFREYSEPDEQPPHYEYLEIDICIHFNV